MDILEIFLLIAGGIIFVLSFFIPSRGEKSPEETRKSAKAEIERLVAEEMEKIKGHVDDVVDESIDYAMEKTERSLERLSNEKIMAVNEYSDTVLAEIHKNHEEAMFLYDMLNSKHTNLKDTVSEVNKTVKEAEETVTNFQKLVPERVPEETSGIRKLATAEAEKRSLAAALPEGDGTVRPEAQKMEMLSELEKLEADFETPIAAGRFEPKKLDAGLGTPIGVVKPEPKKTEIIPELKKTETIPEPKKAETIPEPKKTEITPEQKTETIPESKKTEIIPEPKKAEIIPESKKMDAGSEKPAEVKKPAEAEKSEPKKFEPQKLEPQKFEPKKFEPKKVETKVVQPSEEAAVSEKSSPEKTAGEEAGRISFIGASDEDERNNNERILELNRQGKSNVAIAKELGLGVGEVKLVIELFKNQ